jgi:phospholipid/cholesterol/gamma-HCH transport system ATP-binding protein
MPSVPSPSSAPRAAAAPPDVPLVQIDDVVLRFGEKTVLDGISFKVQRGERLVVMGQSGGGKSTLLRLVMGILKPTSGRVLFAGTDVAHLPRRQLNAMRARIGMVYQYSALISSLTVRDNLALPMEELTDKSTEEIDELVAERLAAVDMSDTEAKMPAELSGGMRKRVGLARALMLEPELILYDEPSAGLDPVTSSVIDELIVDTSERTHSSAIIVTHEMDSAFRVATRMAMLYQGKIIADDTPEHFKHSSNEVVAQFVSGSTHGPIGEHGHPHKSPQHPHRHP